MDIASPLYARFTVILLLVFSATSCASLPPDWQLRRETGQLQYFTRQGPAPSLPEFKATINVDASIDDVMAFMTDFKHHTDWVHGCQESEIIALEDYSQAYIYQVTKLPVVKGRDMIMSAKTSYNDHDQVTIEMTAKPHFCDDNNSNRCQEIRNNHYVRVTNAEGQFVLTPLSETQTQIEWIQFLDPAGQLPDWLYRANLAQVPIKSLEKLKSILENKPTGT